MAPSRAPMPQAPSTTTGSGRSHLARTPEVTAQIAKMDPMEMSMWPASTTSVMPKAAISTGTFARKRSARLSGAKNPGAATASTAERARIAIATDASRRPSAMSGVPVVIERQRQDFRLRRFGAAHHATNRPAMHDGNPVAHAEDLGQLRRDHQNREPLFGEHLHQGMNL